MSSEEQLLPNHSKLDLALRSIGYSFEAAVADVIDNSIDAEAKNILVRLFASRSGHLDLAIWDDGHGMTAETLKEAMRFGADVPKQIERLGKFGLGLKLASLSQAKEVRVLTIHEGVISGRAWLEQGVSRGFVSTVFDRRECARLLAEVVPDRAASKSGTLVWWSNLYRGGHIHRSSEERAQKLMRRLEGHLSMAFHRFLSWNSGRVSISLDIFDEKSGLSGVPADLDPLDPFKYGQSGHAAFPDNLIIDGPYKDKVSIRAHVWPPNSSSPEYKLPGGSNARQGFYFYRNNRLIQGGGWNGIREAEPHSSLARLEMNIKSGLDIDLSLDVKKVEIQLPPELADAIQKSKTKSGIEFKRYLHLANEAYRKRSPTDDELPTVPSFGIPAELARFLVKEFQLKSTQKYRETKIKWSDLDDDSFFELDRDRGELYLNRDFRKQLLHGTTASATDLPVVKCLLFLLVEEALRSERMGPKIREKTERLNRILLEAVKYERSDE